MKSRVKSGKFQVKSSPELWFSANHNMFLLFAKPHWLPSDRFKNLSFGRLLEDLKSVQVKQRKSNWSQVSFVILKGKVQPQINECFCASGRVSEISSVYSLIRWSEMALGTYKHRFKKTTTPASLSRNHETGT